MTSIREALQRAMKRADDEASYRVYYETKDALAELEALEAVAEAARRYMGAEYDEEQVVYDGLINALARLAAVQDGQHSNAALTDRESSPCPCRVHGDPDGDCGENCG